MKKIKSLLVFAMISFTLLFNLAPSLVYAALNPAKDAIQQGACDASGQTTSCDSATATTSLNDTVTNIINILSVIVGIVAVIMIIIAGFRYVTSGGVAESVASAKRSLLYAVIGLVVVALAQVIVRFVLKNTA